MEKVKVLWFANTPGLGEEYLSGKTVSGGWLKSLDAAIQDTVDLHIAFYYPKQIESFKYRNTTYYPIVRSSFLVDVLRNMLKPSCIDNQDLPLYIEIINNIQPDIIHIHGTENPFGCIIPAVTVPVVVSIQGVITVCHHRFCTGIEPKYLRTTWPALEKKYLTRGLFPFNRIYKSFAKRAVIEQRNLHACKYIIGRTDWDRRVTSVLAPKSNYYKVGEILRPSFFQFTWVPHYNEKLIICTTNSDSYFKGFESIAMSVTLLNRMGVDFEWRVAGISRKDLVVKIVKRKLGANYPDHNLSLLGILEESKLVETLLESNIYVMTSHIENSPNNLCEAMALGMPCIATNAGGTSSILENGRQGILIQDGDPWALVGAILELNKDRHYAQQLGISAREIAIKRHSKEQVSKELEVVYATILNTHK